MERTQLKTRGWFQILTGLVLFGLSLTFQAGASNFDFDKEIRKREIVSVRLSDEFSAKAEAARSEAGSLVKDNEPDQENDSSTFSVRLKPIRR